MSTSDYAVLLDGVPQVDAELAQQLLDDAGIPCLVEAFGIDAQLPPEVLGQRQRGLQVRVRASDVEAARDALEAAWGQIPERFDPRAR